jgi:2-polyprenyl-6-methoxyphenol hydroxylase-like FAD-dependent oxidoreductase
MTERILLGSLSAVPNVHVKAGWKVRAVSGGAEAVRVTALEIESGLSADFPGRFACACDGSSSSVAAFLGVLRRVRRHPVEFVMGDYRDQSALDDEAHLYFTRRGSVESFPVAGGLRRWIIQNTIGGGERTFEALEAQVAERTGWRLRPQDRVWSSWFHPESTELSRFSAGRVVFCGDAAHTMPPIGGQGMNTGFADAQLLSRALVRILRGNGQTRRLLGIYERYRRIAFRAAARRSALFMNLGTVRAPLLAQGRNLLVRLLARGPLLRVTARHFAMLNIPYATLEKVLRREPLLRAEGESDEAAEP